MALINAFNKLNYESPEQEAQMLLLLNEGLATAILKGSKLDAGKMIQFILKKYNL